MNVTDEDAKIKLVLGEELYELLVAKDWTPTKWTGSVPERRPYYAILDGRRVIPTSDMNWYTAWWKVMQERAKIIQGIPVHDRQVGYARFDADKTGLGESISVSTVFLGIDHNFLQEKPHWFETMIFGGPYKDEIVERYETWEEAEEGHKVYVDEVEELVREHMEQNNNEE